MLPSPSRRKISFPLMALALAATLVFAWAKSGLLNRDLELSSFDKIYAARDAHARAASTVRIAVVYAEGEEELYYGARLAFPDGKVTVQGRVDGGVPRHKTVNVEIVPKATGNSADAIWEQTNIARRLARDPDYVAVIGHTTSAVAMLASVSYQYTKLLYFATTASDSALTAHGFGYTFRTIGTDAELARELAEMCSLLNRDATGKDSPVEKVGVFYAQSQHSLSAMEDVEGALTDRGISAIFEKSYDPALGSGGDTIEEHQRKALLLDQVQSVEHLNPEMIAVVGDGAAPAVELWHALSRSRLKDVPLVLMGGPLDANAFIDNTDRQPRPGEPDEKSYPTILNVHSTAAATPEQEHPELELVIEAERNREPGAIYVSSQFTSAQGDLGPDDLNLREPEFQRQVDGVKEFNQEYSRQYGKAPNQALRTPEALGLRGYTAAAILRQAMEHSESVAPIDVQQTLKVIEFQALGRKYTFDLKGDEKGLGKPDLPVIFKMFSRRK